MNKLLKFQIALLTIATFAVGVAFGLYLAAAFIGPSIVEGVR